MIAFICTVSVILYMIVYNPEVSARRNTEVAFMSFTVLISAVMLIFGGVPNYVRMYNTPTSLDAVNCCIELAAIGISIVNLNRFKNKQLKSKR